MQNLPTVVDPRSSGRRKPARWRRYLVWYALIAPNVILFAIFGLLPIVATVLISFARWNILGSPSWIGLQNFQRLLHDAEFWTSLRVTLVYALLFVIPSAGIALGQALLISLAGRWQAWFRTIYFIPVVTSITVIAMIWGWLFLPDDTRSFELSDWQNWHSSAELAAKFDASLTRRRPGRRLERSGLLYGALVVRPSGDSAGVTRCRDG